MMHRWGRTPLSCQACRDKKRRCDRKSPCSNCALRGIGCIRIDGQTDSGLRARRDIVTQTTFQQYSPEPLPFSVSARSALASRSKSEEVLLRLKNLEDAVFNGSSQTNTSPHTAMWDESTRQQGFTPFTSHLASEAWTDEFNGSGSLAGVTSRLPPLSQARIIMNNHAQALNAYWALSHVPTCQKTIERAYGDITRGETPSSTDILTLFGIFTGAAFMCTPDFLRELHATESEAKAASLAYFRLALVVLENKEQPIAPSTAALSAITGLFIMMTHTRGFSDTAISLRMKCHAMADFLHVSRLDTRKSRDKRLLKGRNAIDVELLRRVWWHLMAHDWLSAFSGNQSDGAYLFQPKHMNIRLPSNTNDEYITATGVEKEFPLSEPTTVTPLLYRIKVAEICREIVDTMPSVFADDADEPSYDTVLAMDKKFQDLLNELPVFMRMDAESIAKSQDACNQFPSIPLQRTGFHLSIHTRICRLHRPYHLEGLTDPRYRYSNQACIRAAQSVLEIRREMDVAGRPLGANPARSWIVMQHVFVAGLILATDVSFNPSAPDAESRKAKVLAILDILERSVDDSGNGMEGVRRNMQTLVSTLQGQRQQTAGRQDWQTMDDVRTPKAMVDADLGHGDAINEELSTADNDWDRLWVDFIEIAPDVDAFQWDMVFGDINAAMEN